MIKRKKEYKFKSGIYKIVCKENGFVYIGQSVNGKTKSIERKCMTQLLENPSCTPVK